jgi:hypothetical protein
MPSVTIKLNGNLWLFSIQNKRDVIDSHLCVVDDIALGQNIGDVVFYGSRAGAIALVRLLSTHLH